MVARKGGKPTTPSAIPTLKRKVGYNTSNREMAFGEEKGNEKRERMAVDEPTDS